MTTHRLAPEWARQDAIVFVWPNKQSDWDNKQHPDQLSNAEKTYAELTRYISRYQRVVLIAYDIQHKAHIEEHLSKFEITTNNIEYLVVPTNDTWVRDYGPICVYDTTNHSNKLLDFTFDAWGQKYTYEKDNAFNLAFAKAMQIEEKYKKIDHVLEAGNIEINQRGELLVSSSCFIRNTFKGQLNKPSLERLFNDWFNSQQVYWLDDLSLIGDDTDGHIDNMARFCNDDLIVYSATGNKADENNSSLTSLHQQVQKYKNSFELIPLPVPDPIFLNRNQLPASYTNFLITNDSVFIPVFNDKRDDPTLKLIDECFPTREIIDIESTSLIQQLGGIHCSSMQIPQGVLL